MKEFATRHVVLDKERTGWQQVMFIGGHTDDDAMFRLTSSLAKQKIGVTIATLTNSDARDPNRLDPDQLVETRWNEALRSGRIGGVAQVKRLEAPDGRLRLYKSEAMVFTGDLIDEINPIAAVTLHAEDQHTDHSTSHEVTLAVAGKLLPVYSTDTINGLGLGGRPLTPDLYIPLTEEIEAIERQNYLANASQVTDLPPDEMVDVANVIDMTRRRGRERDEDYAAVLFEVKNTEAENPLAEILVYSRVA